MWVVVYGNIYSLNRTLPKIMANLGFPGGLMKILCLEIGLAIEPRSQVLVRIKVTQYMKLFSQAPLASSL